MRRIICSVKPQAQKIEASSTRSKITALEDRIASIREALDNPEIDEDESIELQQELSELEDQLNFAWQDDEAEWDYARQQQEFNPDGSLKGYGDEVYSSENAEWKDDPNADLYVVKIWHEVEANAEDAYGPEAAEEIIDVVANSPDQAIERAKMQWSGPIDRIEIVDINPEDSGAEVSFTASTNVVASDAEDDEYISYDDAEWNMGFMDIENDVIDKLGLYLDFSAVRGDSGPVYIFADPQHENNADMWMGDPDAELARLDFSEYASGVESNVLCYPETDWASKFTSYLKSLID